MTDAYPTAGASSLVHPKSVTKVSAGQICQQSPPIKISDPFLTQRDTTDDRARRMVLSATMPKINHMRALPRKAIRSDV